MAVTNPVDWEAVENGVHTWLRLATTIPSDRIRIQTPRDDGEAKGPAPKATISLLSLVPTSQQMITPQRRTMQQRYTVIADGPGEVGVDFYAGDSLVPQRISIMAALADPPDVSAAALLAQLTADLPTGYTAIIDPADAASVLVTGDTDSPVFASRTADAAMLTVSTTMPGVVNLLIIQHIATWRISFRANEVAGGNAARNAMASALLYRKTYLDPGLYPLGFTPAGEPFTESNVPTDRAESLAVLDIAAIGPLTGAVAAQIMRAAGLSLEAA
jgi:hypothetical protein